MLRRDRCRDAFNCLRLCVLVVQNISVESLPADLERVGVLPHVTLEIIFRVVLRRPNSTAERLPINQFLKPRQVGVNAAVQRRNVVKERLANVRYVVARELEPVTLFILVGVGHRKPNGQLQQNARAFDNPLAESGFGGGIARRQSVAVVVGSANQAGLVRLLDVALKSLVEIALAVARATNREVNPRRLQSCPVNRLIKNRNIHTAHLNSSFNFCRQNFITAQRLFQPCKLFIGVLKFGYAVVAQLDRATAS